MNLVYAFNHPETVRAFGNPHAWIPTAMAWWGQALALDWPQSADAAGSHRAGLG
jgi:hypothetical protein